MAERRRKVRADVATEPRRGTHLILSAESRRSLDLLAIERGITCSQVVERLLVEAARGLYLARRNTVASEGEGQVVPPVS